MSVLFWVAAFWVLCAAVVFGGLCEEEPERIRQVAARIERLRVRIEEAGRRDASVRPVLDILKGVLDLLADEL